MRTVRLSALAESDLVGIWQYSFEQWDEDQADTYLDELDKAIGLLAENPDLGSKRDYAREGYRVQYDFAGSMPTPKRNSLPTPDTSLTISIDTTSCAKRRSVRTPSAASRDLSKNARGTERAGRLREIQTRSSRAWSDPRRQSVD